MINNAKEKSVLYYLVLLIIFSAPLCCYRIPLTSLVSLSLAKILLFIAWTIIIIKYLMDYTFRVKTMRRLFKIRLLWFAFFFFIIVNIIMLFRSTFLGFGFKMIGLIITVWFLALLLYIVLNTKSRIFSALKMLVISSFPSAIFSIWQLFCFFRFGYLPKIPFIDLFPLSYEESLSYRSYMWYMPSIPRIIGFLAEPNSYGLFLAICLFIALIILLEYNSEFKLTKKWQIIFWASIIINLIVFIFTFSRSGWLSFMVGIGLLFMRNWLIHNRLIFFKYITVFVIFLMIMYFSVHFFIGEDILLKRLGFQEVYPHIKARVESLPYIESYPLLGIGYGSYGIYRDQRFGVSSTHSHYLNYLVEGGILGFASFFFFCLMLVITVYHRNSFSKKITSLYTIPVIMILFNNIFYHTFFLEFVWVVIGISLGLAYLRIQGVSKG